MNSFKRHIASLLLVGFLFPQIANAVHYLVVPHGLFEQQENRHLIQGRFMNTTPVITIFQELSFCSLILNIQED